MSTKRPYLSATQINMFLRCPRQYAFRYIEGLKMPPSGAMKQSGVFHMAAERNYKQKTKTGTDLFLDEMTDYYRQTFDKEFQREEVVLDEGESKEALKEQGTLGVIAHHKTIAPTVVPASPEAVEEKIILPFGKEDFAYDLMGILDVTDKDGVIRDNKMLSRTPTQVDLDKDIQLSTYSILKRMQTGKAESGLAHDVIVKKKEPEAVTVRTIRTREALRIYLNGVGHIAKAIRAEAFPINPTTFWCSKKMCGYWDRCVGRGLVAVDLGENKKEESNATGASQES